MKSLIGWRTILVLAGVAILLLLLGAGGLTLAAQQPKSALPDEKDKKAASLEGTYMIVSGEEGGKAIPEERIKGSLVRFTADAEGRTLPVS